MEAREDNLIGAEQGQLLLNEDAEPFWTARVDYFELIPIMPNELDSTREPEEESNGSDEEGGDVGGNDESRRAVAQEMDELTLQSLVISRDVDSSWGFEEGSHMVASIFQPSMPRK